MIINDAMPKLKIKLNGIEIEGLLHSGAAAFIICKESWDSDWPLQEISTQFVGIGTLSQGKQSVDCIKCIEPEG